MFENFMITPEKSGAEEVVNTGHAHLFVNDTKITCIYGDGCILQTNILKMKKM